MNELKKCPYCKGIPKMKKASIKFGGDRIDKYYVECSDCGAATIQYDTYFPVSICGGNFHKMSRKEAIKTVSDDWNKGMFNPYTRLYHMPYKDKVIWQIRSLLTDVWYGAMVPTESPEWKTGWKLRKIAEDRELLVLHGRKQYDLDEVARILFNDIQVKDIIFGYLEEVREWNFYFNRFIEGEEYVKPSIGNRISDMLKRIGIGHIA